MATDSSVRGPCLNGKGAAPLDERGWLCRAAKPLNGKRPERGCETKQAHELVRGANRREAVIAWGRNRAGTWEPPHTVDALE